MKKAKKGDTVQVHYKGFLDDGEVFDSSLDREPLEFTIGENQVIRGFETAITGKSVDEQVTVRIPPKDAYGEYNDELVFEVERAQFPAHITPRVGMRLEVQAENGQQLQLVIQAITEQSIRLDANHPMAGKTLNFEITLTEIA
ncbi:peptidylprolyl isomerase [candidate division KSB1 bacterium]|nr:peptidylprolyl isomerase [candidate division KSB1 bacterium]